MQLFSKFYYGIKSVDNQEEDALTSVRKAEKTRKIKKQTPLVETMSNRYTRGPQINTSFLKLNLAKQSAPLSPKRSKYQNIAIEIQNLARKGQNIASQTYRSKSHGWGVKGDVSAPRGGR